MAGYSRHALWDASDFPEMIADRYHVHNVEMVRPHLGSFEPSRLRDFTARLAKAHSRLTLRRSL